METNPDMVTISPPTQACRRRLAQSKATSSASSIPTASLLPHAGPPRPVEAMRARVPEHTPGSCLLRPLRPAAGRTEASALAGPRAPSYPAPPVTPLGSRDMRRFHEPSRDRDA
jgi:hypothetical protein